jgi:AcrR family transcriptional regulator
MQRGADNSAWLPPHNAANLLFIKGCFDSAHKSKKFIQVFDRRCTMPTTTSIEAAPLSAAPNQAIAPPQPLRAAKQERSKMLMRSVREATLELIRKGGPEEITTVKIAERAGISIGSLYRYYPNKQAIFTDIYQDALRNTDARLRANMFRARAEQSMEELIREGVEVTVSFHRELLALNAGFFIAFRRNFDIAGLGGPGTAAGDTTCGMVEKPAESWDQWAERWLLQLMESNRQRLRVTDLPAAARFIMDMASGTIHHIVETRPAALEGTLLEQQLTELICGYLLAPREYRPVI